MKSSILAAVLTATFFLVPIAHAQAGPAPVGNPETDTLQLWGSITSSIEVIAQEAVSAAGQFASAIQELASAASPHSSQSAPQASGVRAQADSFATAIGSFQTIEEASSGTTSSQPGAPIADASSAQPVIERITEYEPISTDDFVTQNELNSQLQAFSDTLAAKFNTTATSSVPESVLGDGNPLVPYAAENAINNLSNVTITNANLTASEIPGLDYLSLSGGTLSGNLELNGDATTTGISYFTSDVGIGTSTSDALAINGSEYLADITPPTATANRLYSSGGDLYWAGSVVSSSAIGHWTSDGTNTWRLSGDVGIGTSSPFAALSVVGSGYFTGALSAAFFNAVNSTTTNATSTSLFSTFGNFTTGLINTLSGTALTYTAASTTNFSNSGTAYFGSAGQTTVDSAGDLNVGGSFIASGNLTLGNATSTSLFANVASSTNLFAQTASLGSLAASSLTLNSALGVRSGGTGSTTLSGLLKGNGSGAVTTAVAGTDYQLPLTLSYPFINTSNTITLGFGTTTTNTWSQLQTLNGGASATYFITPGNTQTLSGSQTPTLLSHLAGNWAGSTSVSGQTGVNYNTVSSASDALSVPNGAANELYVVDNLTNGWNGSRFGLHAYLDTTATTSLTNPGFNEVAVQGVSLANYNEGGSSSGFGTSTFGSGGLFGANFVADAAAGATDLNQSVGEEVDVENQAGSSVSREAGIQLVHETAHAVEGTNVSVGLLIGDQVGATAGWRNAITVGEYNSQFPMDPNGYLFQAEDGENYSAVPSNAAGGIDLEQANFTGTGNVGGGFAFRSQNFEIDNNGGAQIGYGYLSSTSTGLSIDVSELQMIGTPTVQSGGSGFTTGDLAADAYGDIVSANVTAGSVTSVTVVRRGWTKNPPSNPIAFTALDREGADYGTGLTLNESWASQSSLILNPSGGNVGIGTTTPGSIFSVSGVANWTTSTSTYYSSGGINLNGGCFAVQGTCIGGGAVSSVSNSDGTLTISPTTGSIVASLSLSHPNIWTGLQQFGNASSSLFSSFGPSYFGGTATSSFASTGALSLVTNGLTVGTNQLVVSGGNVGIGTSSPSQSLSLGGHLVVVTTSNDSGAGGYGTGTGWFKSNQNNTSVVINNTQTGGKQWALRSTGGSGTPASSFIIGNVTAGTNPLVINSTGNIGIGTSTPYSRLTVWGPDTASTSAFMVVNNASTTEFNVLDNGNATLSGNLIQNSDERLKTNIQSLDASSSLSLIDSLNPVTFNWIDPGKGTTPQLGFIAQQVLPIFPNLISTTSATALTPDGTLSLNDVGLISPIVSAIQALSTELTSIENTIAGFAQSITSAIGNFGQVNTNELCVGTTCVTPAQFQAMVAAASESGTAPDHGDDASSNSQATDTPPVIQINGDNPAIVQVGETYNDLSATITGPQADLNLGITTYVNGIEANPVQIDTSAVATDTIDYVATDQNGLTSTSTRTIIIEASPSIVPTDDVSPTADTDDLASSTDATTTAQ